MTDDSVNIPLPPSPPPASVSLDALLSPKDDVAFDAAAPNRESIAESTTSEDDARFSTVSLNPPTMSSIAETSEGTPTSPTATLAPSLETFDRTHKKSASTTTIRSNHSLSFVQKHSEDVSNKRASVDGQAKLQEEFARLQKEKEDVAEEHESNGEVIDWDFWGAVMGNYHEFANSQPERLAEAIAQGIPHTLRGMMWQFMAASKDPELESEYLKLLKESSPHEKAITRDLGRTFPHHAFFTDGQGIGQENLFNVLKAYSLHDPQVGYCQGLPFVVAILLLNMPDEEAFSLLCRLMEVYDLRGHFLPEMPKLQSRLFQFDRLIEEMLPVLHVHFLRQGIKSSMYCSQWFLTMFSYRFPLDVVFRIYDNVLASGIEAIFGFSVALLAKNEDILLGLKFDEILGFMNTKLFDRYKLNGDQFNVDEFVHDATSLRITPFQLDSYSHEYDDLMKEVNKNAIEKDELRNTNRMLTAQVKKLENDLAQLNTDHVDVLNELVKMRLRNEETEGELVRYKLLYAEAMHQNASHPDGQAPPISGTTSPPPTNRVNSIASMFSMKRGSS
ncbi:RabGAP/TBC [Cylindrobasidium torrendii FP15055 ss-10]|uniref:RabGAP/TBC n=1 Tax=Cylindrobasidium torrendii FP15055 ss-10 TaxID=1314674 RepID=A0A0D7BR76_9AGAR|nr:RabGAP/TBC [Cylindrobasidium torrendii FP15055 ss-10]